jgi:hypothetical protein
MDNKSIEREALQHVFGIEHVESDEHLRDLVTAKMAAMDPVERTATTMRLGMKVDELKARQPGTAFSPATWSLVVTSLFAVLFTAVSVYLILDTTIWLIAKIVVGFLGFIAFVASLRAFGRVIFRLVNKRDV